MNGILCLDEILVVTIDVFLHYLQAFEGEHYLSCGLAEFVLDYFQVQDLFSCWVEK